VASTAGAALQLKLQKKQWTGLTRLTRLNPRPTSLNRFALFTL
jgi:hypothetical protein